VHPSRDPTSRRNSKPPPRLWLHAPILLSKASGKAGSGRNPHLRCASHGQSLVEFALVVPLLLLLLIGAVEIGRAAYFSIAVTNAARAAVQYGAQSPVTAADDIGIKQHALNDAPMLSPSDVTWSNYCQCPNGNPAPNCFPTDCSGGRFISYLQVNTQMQLTPLIGFPGLPASFPLRGQAIMEIGK
jgi:hypothetical protein